MAAVTEGLVMRVAVLGGGRSPEHQVSLRSAAQVVEHLDRTRHEVVPVLLDLDGLWWVPPAPLRAGERLDRGYRQPGARGVRPGAAVDQLVDLAVDVVFPVLHGPNGEDGTVQGMLALHGLAIVGSGCAASAVAMDKIRTRECLMAAGIELAKAYVPRTPWARADAAQETASIAREVGFPAFLKVDCSGSTIGVARVTDAAGVSAFLVENRGRGRRWFAEAELRGEEVTAPVLGNTGQALEALPPIGIYPRRAGYFTHDEKYREDGAEEVIPPRGLTSKQCQAVQQLAIRCHEALQCDGMSRTDMIWGAAGPVVLEVNTIPGLTARSLLPRAAAAHGLPFPALVERLLELAVAARGREPR
jgi:D-alanine-D-alanine ligase